MKVAVGLVALLVLMTMIAGLVSFSSTVKADVPITDASLYFSSIDDLNSFYQKKKFGVIEYNGGGWKDTVEIDKSKIYNPNDRFYVLAPYDYKDDSGYPHKVAKDGCMITLNNIDNATVIITGFRKATITVNNFHGKLILGKYVSLQKKVEHHEEWWDFLLSFSAIGWASKIASTISVISNLPPGHYEGLIDSVITINGADEVYLQHICVSSTYANPILITDAKSVHISGVYLTPSEHSMVDGSGIILQDVDALYIHGNNTIQRYRYDLNMRNIGSVDVQGELALSGAYYNDTNTVVNYGYGIYADRVGNISNNKTMIHAKIGEGYYADVVAHANGTYNETSQNFTGYITNITLFIYGSNIFLTPMDMAIVGLKDNIPISGKVNLSDKPNATFDMRGVNPREYNNENATGTLNYSNLTVFENDTGRTTIIPGNNTNYTMHTYMKLSLSGYLLNGSEITALVNRGISFKHLPVALGVADDGKNEQPLIDYLNNSAGAVEDVDTLVAYNVGYISSTSTMNVPLIFGGFSAIISIFVAIGWMRVGYIMHSVNQQNREKAKDMIFKASVGTIITAMVIFGWANLIGLMNWVFGG